MFQMVVSDESVPPSATIVPIPERGAIERQMLARGRKEGIVHAYDGN